MQTQRELFSGGSFCASQQLTEPQRSRVSRRKCPRTFAASDQQDHSPPEARDKRHQLHQKRLKHHKQHRESLAQLRQQLQDRSSQREDPERLLDRVTTALIRKAAIPGSLAASAAWLLGTDPFNHWTWNQDTFNAILCSFPLIALDVSILLADWKPETMRELIQVEVENSPSDKAEWEADRAELLRLGIVEEAVLDQMEVIWGAKNVHTRKQPMSLGRHISVGKPPGVLQATARGVQERLAAGNALPSLPIPAAIGGQALTAAAGELFWRFTVLGGFAAWITARLYEAGLEDPSSLTEGAWPVAQLGSTLAVALPASAAFFTGGRILIQATLRAAATSRRPAQDFRRMSKQAVEASQQVDLRTAADFKAGRRLSSLQSEDTPESQPGGDSPPGSQQAEAAASKAESSPEGKGASSSGKPRSRKVPPELAELLQRVQGMARERSSGAPSRDIFALPMDASSALQALQRQMIALKLGEAFVWFRLSLEWSFMGLLYFSSSGNLAFTFTASLARRLAMLAPSQLIQRRSREQLPENLDLMLERDDAKTLLYEARQRLESYFAIKNLCGTSAELQQAAENIATERSNPT